jgi:hypothetical protein
VLLDQVRKLQRAGEPRRPRADNQHIRFELFPLNRHGASLANGDDSPKSPGSCVDSNGVTVLLGLPDTVA